MANPTVSIVIPARNAARTITATLSAALAQDYPGDIQIVVADGSDNDSMARIIRETVSRRDYIALTPTAKPPRRSTGPSHTPPEKSSSAATLTPYSPHTTSPKSSMPLIALERNASAVCSYLSVAALLSAAPSPWR